jgi:Protein of unknown function (DUF3551)
MSKIYEMAAAMAVSAATLIAISAPASAASRHAGTNYCLAYSRGGSDCGFTSRAQCEATASGQGGECYRNVYGKEGELLHW